MSSLPALVALVQQWQGTRSALSEREAADSPSAKEWQCSDDAAASLLLQATEILEATNDLVELHPDMWLDQATAFSCHEADAIARLLRSAGRGEVVDAFLAAHAQGDDEGDQHYLERESDDAEGRPPL